jgi:aminoglycoside phosphotransferase family enzyme/predicted kinase
MKPATQAEAIAFLSDPKTYGADVQQVRRIETHISVIFLAGARAFKLKKAVRYPYLDFSTVEKRRAACHSEIAVNRRAAPQIYRGVVVLARGADGRFALGGTGEPVEWLVEMARFDEDTLFDRLARRGALERHRIEELAETVAAFHCDAERRPDVDSVASFAGTIAGNAASMAGPAAGAFNPGQIVRLREWSEAQLAALRGLLDERRERSLVRRCHGDLHLGNICLIDGKPVLFDAIEFNESFAVIDTLYDAAFLVMDLDHLGQRAFAGQFLNRYLDAANDDEGLPALPLFLSLRAAIRAHVGATAARAISDRGEADRRLAEARVYFDEAFAYLAPGQPRLIAVGGLSGSGKSRLASALAPWIGAAPGARVVRTDVIRKQLAAAPLHQRLGPEGYTAEMSERTYAELDRRVAAALDAGRSAIADAVFARPEERERLAGIAKARGVPFDGLWLEADAAVMERRLAERRADVSDATVEVLRRQRTYDLGDVTWARIASGGAREETLAQVLTILGIGVSPLSSPSGASARGR